MLLHLGTEYIVIMVGDQTLTMPFEQVEEHLTQTMIDLYRTHLPKDIYVINGPGSFTNLRVGALVVNMLAMLSHQAFVIWTTNKMDLYRYGYHQWLLPQWMYLWIGQRKNLRYYDRAQDEHTVVKKTDPDVIERIQTLDRDRSYAVDQLMDKDFEIFHDHPGAVCVSYVSWRVIISYDGSTLDCTDMMEPVQSIEPYYGMKMEYEG